jgi:SPP1 family predicted phage head-tail adaptor
MNAGKLDRRIRIESKQVTQEAEYGTQTVTWAEFATVWANVQDVLPSRAEGTPDGIRIANRPARIRIRWIAGVTSDMRIVLLDRDDRLLQIVGGPAEMGRKDGIEMVGEEYSTAGSS